MRFSILFLEFFIHSKQKIIFLKLFAWIDNYYKYKIQINKLYL